MKIALVTHNVVYGDGQGRAVLELSKYLASRGHRVDLIAHRVDARLAAVPGVEWRQVHIHLRKPNLLMALEFATKATLLLRSRDYDIIHLHGAVGFARHHVNTGHFIHSAWLGTGAPERPGLRGYYHRVYRHFNAWVEGPIFRRADVAVGVSRKVQGELVKYCHVHPTRTHAIYNGVDTDEFKPHGGSEREKLVESLGCPPDAFLIGFLGDLRTGVKGFSTLLASLQGLTGTWLVAIGPFDGSPYPQWARDLGIADRVLFLGYRTDIPELLRSVDAFIHPSRYESFGMAVTEAAACARPVVVSAASYCGAAELFENGRSALLLNNPSDANEIRQCVRKLRDDPGLRERLAEGGRDAILPYTWSRMGQEYEKLYMKVLTSGA